MVFSTDFGLETLQTVQSIQLKTGLEIRNGAHILYAFQSKTAYTSNLAAYVADGIRLGHMVVVIEHFEMWIAAREKLLNDFSAQALESVFFDEADVFYGIESDFQTDKIVQHFEELIGSLPQTNAAIRTWARVLWGTQQHIQSKLEEFEGVADDSVKGLGLLSVCAYDQDDVSSDMLLSLLRKHDYFMTDAELVLSPLYARHRAVFPSLSVQSKIESEIDFYKSKLDFVHVVSHEVRNPLTIINGYANIVRNNEPHLSKDSLDKLAAIEHYVSAIDQELSNIIETERMLSKDLYLKLEPIRPLEVTQKVAQLMQTKCVVENVKFAVDIRLLPTSLISGNIMGLRLILSNLISNAIKYTGEEGIVEFSAESRKDEIRFVVKDNGPGISRTQLNSLYQKYAKFDETKSGQGIGLYIVKNLTDSFGGQLVFDSHVGIGTKVTVRFPLLE